MLYYNNAARQYSQLVLTYLTLFCNSIIYRCTSFPESFSTNAGLSSSAAIPDSANLTQSFAAGNITAAATVDIVNEYVATVYASSSGVDANPYACDVNGLATLKNCDKSTTDTPTSLRSDGDIVKSVTLAGAFVPVTWATGGKILTMEEVKDFYTSKDFRRMSTMGVNTVQIPVPCDAFYDKKSEVVDTLSHLLERADKAGLSAIIVLVMADDKEDEDITAEMIDKHISLAAKFASDTSNVIALQLPTPSPSLLSAVRSVSTTLSVLVPTNVGQINNLSFPPDSNIFAALDVGATTGVANVASSDSESDRMKMFYRELLNCFIMNHGYFTLHFLTLFILFTFTSSLYR